MTAPHYLLWWSQKLHKPMVISAVHEGYRNFAIPSGVTVTYRQLITSVGNMNLTDSSCHKLINFKNILFVEGVYLEGNLYIIYTYTFSC